MGRDILATPVRAWHPKKISQHGGRPKAAFTKSREMAWLRQPRRRSARAEADAQLRRLKAQALGLRIAREAGELMEFAEHIEIIDELCGLVRSELSALPARLTRDVRERRRIEEAVAEVLGRLSARAQEKARLAEMQSQGS